jgi:PAS domain S-box-containing protein
METLEEQICLYAVGLLPPSEAEQLEAHALDQQVIGAQLNAMEELSCRVLDAYSPRVAPSCKLRARIMAAIENEPGLVLTDREGFVVGVNDAFTAMCGYRLDEIVAKKPGRLLQGPETFAKAARAMSEAVHAGRGCEQDILNYRRDGEPYWVRIKITPLHSADGELKGFAAVERKLRKDELSKLATF